VSCVQVLRGVSRWAAAATVPVAAGSLALLVAGPAGAVSLGGAATIAKPGATAATPLLSGGSATTFTVALPPSAACSGDTMHAGYHIYSYLVKRGTDLAHVRFTDLPSVGYGIVTNGGRYYGPVNTAMSTGEIVEIPNDFAWAHLVKGGGGNIPLSQLLYAGSSGAWDTGLACANTHGTLSNDWNTDITFLANAADRAGFVWWVDATAATGVSEPFTSGTATSPSSTRPVAVAKASSTGATGSPMTDASPTGRADPASGPAPDVASPSPAPATTGTTVSAGSDLPIVGILAGLLLVVGAGIAVFLRLWESR
jgi:hypothetical protein